MCSHVIFQVVLDLLEMREMSAARALLTQTKALQWLKEHAPTRYATLDSLYAKNYFDVAQVSFNNNYR
jgi:WD40 repeat-containing protein SMU1